MSHSREIPIFKFSENSRTNCHILPRNIHNVKLYLTVETFLAVKLKCRISNLLIFFKQTNHNCAKSPYLHMYITENLHSHNRTIAGLTCSHLLDVVLILCIDLLELNSIRIIL